MRLSPRWARRLRAGVVALAALVVFAGFLGWYKLFRVVPQPDFARRGDCASSTARSAPRATAGFPYWVWIVLPRVFPDLLPGSGGYASLGLTWEPGQELPVGFAKKTVGFPRVTNNCAVCHTARYRVKRGRAARIRHRRPGAHLRHPEQHPLPDPLRERSALRGRGSCSTRSRGSTACPGSTGSSTSTSSSRSRGGRCSSRSSSSPGWTVRASRTGAPAATTP